MEHELTAIGDIEAYDPSISREVEAGSTMATECPTRTGQFADSRGGFPTIVIIYTSPPPRKMEKKQSCWGCLYEMVNGTND